ncbi:tRNA pseudouridine(13) synthase TruD, partial [Candidatus Nitrosarchaeum limnium]
MIPEIDSQIGISVFSTTFNGIGGQIRSEAEDFQVSEVISDKSLKSISTQEGYAVYKLKKRKIDTNHALSDIFRKTGIRLKALGLKDAFAVTEQFVCSDSRGKSIENYSSDKYSIEKIGFVKKPLSKKDMIANHFNIK